MNKWLNLHTQNSITMEFRIEKDSLGEVQVPAKQYWAAQTQRSLQNFKIGGAADKMPLEIIRAFAILKKAAAFTSDAIGGHFGDDTRRFSARYAHDGGSLGRLWITDSARLAESSCSWLAEKVRGDTGRASAPVSKR